MSLQCFRRKIPDPGKTNWEFTLFAHSLRSEMGERANKICHYVLDLSPDHGFSTTLFALIINLTEIVLPPEKVFN